MLQASAGGVGLPACDSTRRALRLSEYAQRFISQPARLKQKTGWECETNRRPASVSIVIALEFCF
jgi:hypothetical protein